jgi:hypothetical protein
MAQGSENEKQVGIIVNSKNSYNALPGGREAEHEENKINETGHQETESKNHRESLLYKPVVEMEFFCACEVEELCNVRDDAQNKAECDVNPERVEKVWVIVNAACDVAEKSGIKETTANFLLLEVEIGLMNIPARNRNEKWRKCLRD